jgi:hypothetical protein
VLGVILVATWSLIRCKEGGRLKEKFFLLAERRGKTPGLSFWPVEW